MTVVPTPVPARSGQQRPGESDPSLVYARIREITGAPDAVIDKAIKVCMSRDGHYKVEDIVNTILEDSSRPLSTLKTKGTGSQESVDQVDAMPGSSSTPEKQAKPGTGQQETGQRVPGPGERKPSQEKQNIDFIDLTRDQQGILGGQISREEQDISRILEESLAESKNSAKRKRGELWIADPLNPHERKREEDWPVGLKNVGNTCWFSAVIQSLFHIHQFRNVVLNYKTPETSPETRTIRFVKELKALFALLVGSRRKYVDPSKVVDILKEDSKPTVLDGQQDVSEFQHKLLDWLEDALSTPPPTPAGSASTSEDENNPVKKLFQGKYKAEGINEGKTFCREETFGQYPLNISGFSDIHESLEASTAQGEIETVRGDTSEKSGQEIWFTHLPVVLTFELSRFGFNQELNRAEKIHQQLAFPEVIYVDRYLESNKLKTRQKREEARKLREQLGHLQQKLDRYMNYGSSPKRYPLHDVLQYALEFAESTPNRKLSTPPPAADDVDMESPHNIKREYSDFLRSASRSKSSSSHETTPTRTSTAHSSSTKSHKHAPGGERKSSQDIESTRDMPEPKKFKDSSVQTCFSIYPSLPVLTPAVLSGAASSIGAGDVAAQNPRPHDVSESELKVLQSCLMRWRKEVESDVRELQKNIASLQEQLNKLYTEPTMKKCPYHLHAVLVHEGQAVSGHYWSFIFDYQLGHWLKFNDITVSTSNWEETKRESVGGHHNASAYCLMYIDRSRLTQLEGNFTDNKSKPEARRDNINSLSGELRDLVTADNRLFAQEIAFWDEEQRKKTSKAAPVTPSKTMGQATESATTSLSTTQSPSTSSSNAAASVDSGQSRRDDRDVVVIGNQRAGENIVIHPLNEAVAKYADTHAQLAMQDTLKAVQGVGLNRKLEDALDLILNKEYKRLKIESSQFVNGQPAKDPRLTNMVLYLLTSGSDTTTVKIILLEQFSLCALLDTTPFNRSLRQCACVNYRREYMLLDNSGVKNYEFWHRRYHHFRQSMTMFICGVEAYLDSKFVEAVPYFNQSWLHNLEPGLTPADVDRVGITRRVLSQYRLKNLKKLNEYVLRAFEEEQEDFTDVLSIMHNQILPTISLMFLSECDSDIACGEIVRGEWCALLEKDLSEKKMEKFQEFLSKLFESSLHMNFDLQELKLSKLSVPLSTRYQLMIKAMKERQEILPDS